MKRKVLIVLVLIVSIVLVGCTNSGNKKDKVIKEGQDLLNTALIALKENDQEGIKAVFGEDTEIVNVREYFSLLFPFFEDSSQKEAEDQLYEKMIDRVNITVDDAGIEDDNWYIYFTIKSLDLSKVSTDSFKEMYDKVLSDDEKLMEIGYEEEELYTMLKDQLLSNMAKDDNLSEYYQKAIISKDENSSIIKADSDTFINGLFGNILDNGDKLTEEVKKIHDDFNKKLDEKLNSGKN